MEAIITSSVLGSQEDNIYLKNGDRLIMIKIPWEDYAFITIVEHVDSGEYWFQYIIPYWHNTW